MDRPRSYNIAMVSDFFFPQPGGVESHIYQLSTKLVDRGHKVIIITHSYGDRVGIRWLTNGIKVYYCPFFVIYRSATFPTVFSFFPLFRNIVLRERIDIVHGHASLSNLCHEAILHARTMGIRTVFTDHSLFGFADASSILTNKLLKFILSDVDHVICVSHTCKENTVLRASLDPAMVSVIPNAVVSENFQPLTYKAPSWQPSFSSTSSSSDQRLGPKPTHLLGPDDPITIIVISRLFYNKGTDLLIAAIPRILQNHPNTRFIIAGDGPKGIDLLQMIEQNVLQEKVLMLGSIRHEEVRDVMVQGHIYLHPSLTEAFGTVIVEAASCGLYVVCTQVGGIPEVLPSHMTIFAKPEEDDLVVATGRAIEAIRTNKVRTERFHEQVKKMYSWRDIAERTERVYAGISGDISDGEFYGLPMLKHRSSRRQLVPLLRHHHHYLHHGHHPPVSDSSVSSSSAFAQQLELQQQQNLTPEQQQRLQQEQAELLLREQRERDRERHNRGVVVVANDRHRSFALIDRLKRYYGCGTWAGKLFCICVVVDYLLFLFLEWLYPRNTIHYAIDWPRKEPPG